MVCRRGFYEANELTSDAGPNGSRGTRCTSLTTPLEPLLTVKFQSSTAARRIAFLLPLALRPPSTLISPLSLVQG